MKIFNKNRLLILTLILTFILTLSITYAKAVGNDIKSSFFRLHIVANSDLDKDQNLKIYVRDRILNDYGYLFENAVSSEDAAKIAAQNLDKIKETATLEIKKQGFDYEVTPLVGEFAFPTKSYGNITLPSGRYRALSIKIGEAKGQNWWCVMYPPLCLTDGILLYNEQSNDLIKNNLSKEEYNLITKTDTGALPVEIRFKIVEVFQKLFSNQG